MTIDSVTTGGTTRRAERLAPLLQAAPLVLLLAVFFVLPLVLIVVVSFWDYNDYAILPDATPRNYRDVFEGCVAALPDLCVTFRTYLSTLKFCLLVWLSTLLIGFTVAYFLAFHVRSLGWQVVLFLVCTIPFWTSNVIRMISWIPLLGRNGVINQWLQAMGVTEDCRISSVSCRDE